MTDWETETKDRETDRLTDWHTEKLRDWDTERPRDWETERLGDWDTRDWETEKMKDWKANNHFSSGKLLSYLHPRVVWNVLLKHHRRLKLQSLPIHDIYKLNNSTKGP